jgi:hypothetical protein
VLVRVNHIFALLRYKAFTGEVPFSDQASLTAMVAIMEGERPPRPTHATFTNGLWELMQQCWNQERHDRPQTLDVLLALDSFMPSPMLPCFASAAAGAPTPVSDIQQQLGGLKPSSKEFRLLLLALLNHQDLKPHILDLQGNDLGRFVELLDDVVRPVSKSTCADSSPLGARSHPSYRRSLSKDLTQIAEYMQQS